KAWYLLWLVAVEHRVEADASLERGDQGERLERRARLGDVLGDSVALDLQVVRAAIHAGDGAGVGIHRQRGDAQVGRVILGDGRHSVDDRLLRGRVNGGHDRVALGLDLLLSDAGRGLDLIED